MLTVVLWAQRAYLGPTSMNTEIAFIMCNMAKVCSWWRPLILFPFVRGKGPWPWSAFAGFGAELLPELRASGEMVAMAVFQRCADRLMVFKPMYRDAGDAQHML